MPFLLYECDMDTDPRQPVGEELIDVTKGKTTDCATCNGKLRRDLQVASGVHL